MKQTDACDLFEIVRDLAKMRQIRSQPEYEAAATLLVDRAYDAMMGSVEVMIEYKITPYGLSPILTESLTVVAEVMRKFPLAVVEQRRHYRSKWVRINGSDMIIDAPLPEGWDG